MTSTRSVSPFWLGLAAPAILLSAPAAAQDEPQAPVTQAPLTQSRFRDGLGVVRNTAVGRPGQRQERERAAGIQAVMRIENRFANRIQSRSRNRLDQYYNATGNPAASFSTAADQVRNADPRRRR